MFLNKNGLHKGSPQFREENCYSLLLMGTLGSILVGICSKYGDHMYATLSKMWGKTGQKSLHTDD